MVAGPVPPFNTVGGAPDRRRGRRKMLGSSPIAMPSFEERVTARIAGLAGADRRALFRAVEAAEAAVALYHRHRAGGRPVPHPIALTPFVVPRAWLPTLGRLADCVHRLQAHAPRLYREDPASFRAQCPLSETTATWLPAAGRHAPWALMIRPDVGLGRGGARARPTLFETNATALAGLYNHTAGVGILEREVFPRVLTPVERGRLQAPPDLLALTVRWVLAAARRLGRRRGLGVAFLEARGPVAGYSEIPRLMRAFAAHGIRAAHGSPQDLRIVRGRVHLRDVPVDVAYRDLGYEDLGPRPAGTARLAGFVALHAGGAVLPDTAGEFGHKGLLECLTAPEYARLFTRAERRLLAACVPWTRVLDARTTANPEGRPVDLPEYVRRHAAALLIKPNVGSSGEGILLGAEAPPGRWDRRISRALREPGAWVVQARRPAAVRPMVYLRDGRGLSGPCHSSLGLFYAPGDLGLHCRVSRQPIVNVARGGALACAFLSR
jgi:hypothetical protein